MIFIWENGSSNMFKQYPYVSSLSTVPEQKSNDCRLDAGAMEDEEKNPSAEVEAGGKPESL